MQDTIDGKKENILENRIRRIAMEHRILFQWSAIDNQAINSILQEALNEYIACPVGVV